MKEKAKTLSLAAKIILVLVCLVLVIPNVIHLCPFLVGADASYIVLSGSMQPTLSPGDLAFTEKLNSTEIQLGDVVAVRTSSRVYMHRVVDKKESREGILFRLKGDANEDPDSTYVNGSEIIGKTFFSLPTGYLYTKNGYILIVVTPLMLLAVNQAIKIYKIYDTRKRRRKGLKAILLGRGGKRRRRISMLDTTSVLLLLILVAGGTQIMAPYFISGSGSFFIDTESSQRNTITADTWKVQSAITCSVSDSNIAVGENVTISGHIDPARSAEVTIEIITDDGNTWTSLTTVTSKANGSYEYEWKPETSGWYKIKASWKGDHSYLSAISEIVDLLMTQEP